MCAEEVIDVDEWHERYRRSDLGMLDKCKETIELNHRHGNHIMGVLHRVIVPEVSVQMKSAVYRCALQELCRCEKTLAAVKDMVDATRVPCAGRLDEVARGELTYRDLVKQRESAVDEELRKCEIRTRFTRQLLDDMPPPLPSGRQLDPPRRMYNVPRMPRVEERGQPLPPITEDPPSSLHSLPRLGTQATPLYTVPIRIPPTPP